jgi:hypothetical protein
MLADHFDVTADRPFDSSPMAAKAAREVSMASDIQRKPVDGTSMDASTPASARKP